MEITQFKKIVHSSNIHCFLYHFTDERNFPSIAQHGLLSKTQLQSIGAWPPAAAGGNDWSWQADEIKGLMNYVNLCFTRNHPMCYVAKNDGRIHTPRYLAISPDVLDIPNLKITFDVANKRNIEVHDLHEASKHIDFEVLYSRTDWRDPAVNARLKASEKYELLVPERVPLELITRVY